MKYYENIYTRSQRPEDSLRMELLARQQKSEPYNIEPSENECVYGVLLWLCNLPRKRIGDGFAPSPTVNIVLHQTEPK